MTISQPTADPSELQSIMTRSTSLNAKPTRTPATGPTQREGRDEVSFECITTCAEFHQLEADWRRLFDRVGRGTQVFQTFDWLWHWSRHFLDDQECTTDLHIVTGRRNGELVLIWPLAVQRCRGLRHLIWMGQPVSQYGDIIVDSARCSSKELERSWSVALSTARADVVHLRKVRQDAACAAVLQKVGATQVELQTAPYLDLQGVDSLDSYQKRYTGKARKNRRRLRRRMGERAPVTSKTVCKGSQRRTLAEMAVVMKRTWLQARGLVSPAIQSEKTRKFFCDAAGSISHPTGCRTSILTVGSQPAALEVSFAAKGHCAVHIIVYNLDFEKAGAGVLLMEDLIGNAIESGIETLDLLAPGDNYKQDWADGAIDVCDWTLAVTRLGRLHNALKLNLLPKMTKAVLLRLPLRARQALSGRLTEIK